jgi:hypothetical protein
MRAWESNHNYNELEDFPFSSDVLYFDNEWWADSDNNEEFGPPHFRNHVALGLRHLVQNPYWTRLWIIQELAVGQNKLDAFGFKRPNSNEQSFPDSNFQYNIISV